MLNTMTVAVDNELRKVPVLTLDHLRVFRQIEKGATRADLAADMRFLDDLIALGWVTTHAVRH
ncbi:hypothetical protein [Brevibacillus choshinensis]|uniref:hypothetical protein n=1 Tax=Brevibacillus choshinensis TaxID=54911 RepID=UPI002E1F1F71|nr:hypothetical protein [Brevibacillus choshinensis]